MQGYLGQCMCTGIMGDGLIVTCHQGELARQTNLCKMVEHALSDKELHCKGATDDDKIKIKLFLYYLLHKSKESRLQKKAKQR